MKSYLEWTDDVLTGDRIINIRLCKSELVIAQLDNFDKLLLADVQNGEPSTTPIADQLLGLETLVRRMEQAQSKAILAELENLARNYCQDEEYWKEINRVAELENK